MGAVGFSVKYFYGHKLEKTMVEGRDFLYFKYDLVNHRYKEDSSWEYAEVNWERLSENKISILST